MIRVSGLRGLVVLLFKISHHATNKMTKQVKVLVVKPNGLSPTPGLHMIEGTAVNSTHSPRHVHAYTYTNKGNKNLHPHKLVDIFIEQI